MSRTALIDADTIIYAAGRKVEKIVEWGDDIISWYAGVPEAEAEFDSLVSSIVQGMCADRTVMALSDYSAPNWRVGVLPTYKMERAKSASNRRPLAWAALRKHCEATYKCFTRPTLEGDDVLGILLTHPSLIVGEKIVVSIDKDMNTLPGLHCNHTRDENDFGWGVRVVSQASADKFHLMQTLMGDATDGYKGCPGVGKVGAEKVLSPFYSHMTFGDSEFDVAGAWVAVVAQYVKAGLTEEDALQQARVARICRATDYDFTTKAVKLWEPPKIS